MFMDNSISLSELDYDDVDHASLSEGNYDTTFSDEKEWSNPSELTSEDIP